MKMSFETDKSVYDSLPGFHPLNYNRIEPDSPAAITMKILVALSFPESLQTLKDQRTFLEKILKSKKLMSKTYYGKSDIWIFKVESEGREPRYYIIYNSLDKGVSINAGSKYAESDAGQDLSLLLSYIKPQLSIDALEHLEQYKPFNFDR